MRTRQEIEAEIAALQEELWGFEDATYDAIFNEFREVYRKRLSSFHHVPETVEITLRLKATGLDLEEVEDSGCLLDFSIEAEGLPNFLDDDLAELLAYDTDVMALFQENWRICGDFNNAWNEMKSNLLNRGVPDYEVEEFLRELL